jgi:hypothetical protein
MQLVGAVCGAISLGALVLATIGYRRERSFAQAEA